MIGAFVLAALALVPSVWAGRGVVRSGSPELERLVSGTRPTVLCATGTDVERTWSAWRATGDLAFVRAGWDGLAGVFPPCDAGAGPADGVLAAPGAVPGFVRAFADACRQCRDARRMAEMGAALGLDEAAVAYEAAADAMRERLAAVCVGRDGRLLPVFRGSPSAALFALRLGFLDGDSARSAAFAGVADLVADGVGVDAEACGEATAWLIETQAGIRPGTDGGYDVEFHLTPEPEARIGAVEASYRTANGLIRSGWRFEGGKCRWRFSVPKGATALVCANGLCREYGSGDHALTLEPAE